jgi:hypothetical protein
MRILAIVIAGAAVVGTAALIARADTAPTITNAIQNSSNTTVTSAPIGSSVHDVVTVASSTASTTPTGTVDFNVYSNTTCSGEPTTQSAVALVDGIATSSSTTVPASGLSYMVHYSGDASTTAANSSCQALTATAANVSISMALSTSSVLAGSSVYATATLNNETADATGTVAYIVYTDNLCTTGADSAGSKSVTSGSIPNSDAKLFNAAGTYYWQAVYSGDQFNSGATSSCLPLTVLATSTPTPPATSTPGTISGKVYNDQNKNDSVDPGEPGIANVTIWLHMGTKKDGYNNPIVQTTTSDANGNYSFTNLALANYFVEEQVPAGWKQTSDDVAVVLGDSNQEATVNFANIIKNASSTGKGHHCDNDGDDDDANCTANTTNGHDNGKHNGWFKNGKLFNINFPWNHGKKNGKDD